MTNAAYDPCMMKSVVHAFDQEVIIGEMVKLFVIDGPILVAERRYAKDFDLYFLYQQRILFIDSHETWF